MASSAPYLTTDLHQIRHVAIAGAGAGGVAQIGAVIALQEQGLLDQVEDFSGTSAGAILAAPCAFGYRQQEMVDTVMKQDFTKFLQKKRMVFPFSKNLRNYGLFSGQEVRTWVELMAAKRLGDARITFTDLKEMREHSNDEGNGFFLAKCEKAKQSLPAYRKVFGDDFTFDFAGPGNRDLHDLEDAAGKLQEYSKRIANLHVVAAKVIKEPGRHNPIGEYQEVVFSHENYSHVSIAQAVRASASFPFVFRHAQIANAEGKMEKFADGGICNVIPLSVFDKDGKTNPHAIAIRAEPLQAEMEGNPLPRAGKLPQLLQKPKNILLSVVDKLHEFRQRRVEKQLGSPVVERENIPFQFEHKMAALFFGPKTVRRTAERFCQVQPDFMANPDNVSRVIFVDRGNVEVTDFSKCTDSVKSWLLRSGREDALQILQDHGIGRPVNDNEKTEPEQVVETGKTAAAVNWQEHPKIIARRTGWHLGK